jgi:hypothetical protein
MDILDPGHDYEINNYDGSGKQRITFLKREGEGYPGNIGHYPGTNCQEVLRVLIDRIEYLDNQIPCNENKLILDNLKSAYWQFEKRAAERHRKEFPYSVFHPDDAYRYPIGEDGHILVDLFRPLIDEAYGFQPWKVDEQ